MFQPMKKDKEMSWRELKTCTMDFNLTKSTGIVEIIRKYVATVLHHSKGKCSTYIGNVNNHM